MIAIDHGSCYVLVVAVSLCRVCETHSTSIQQILMRRMGYLLCVTSSIKHIFWLKGECCTPSWLAGCVGTSYACVVFQVQQCYLRCEWSLRYSCQAHTHTMNAPSVTLYTFYMAWMWVSLMWGVTVCWYWNVTRVDECYLRSGSYIWLHTYVRLTDILCVLFCFV